MRSGDRRSVRGRRLGRLRRRGTRSLRNSRRERIPNFAYALDRFASTVRTLTNMASAISRLVRPSIARTTACRSLSVRPTVAVRPLIRASEACALAAQSGAPSASNIDRADRRDAAASRFRFARRWMSPRANVVRASSNGWPTRAWAATASSTCANAAGRSPRAAAIDPRLRAAVASVRGRSSFSLQAWKGSSTSSARSISPMPMSASTASGTRGRSPVRRCCERPAGPEGVRASGGQQLRHRATVRGIRARIDW